MKFLQVLIASAVCLFSFSAFAAGHDNGATVIDDFGCQIVPADSGLPVVLFSSDSHSVTNYAGNTSMWCDFVFDPALCPSDKAMRFKNFPCGTPGGFATKTMAVTDCEYGVVHLSCQIK